MILKTLKTCYCYSLCRVCSVGKTKVESLQIRVKLALFFQMQASSNPVSLQSDVSLSIAPLRCNFTKKYTLSFQYTGPFYDGGQRENAVIKLTY